MVLPDRSDMPRMKARKIAIAAEIVRPSMPTQVVRFQDRTHHHSTAMTMTAMTAMPKMLTGSICLEVTGIPIVVSSTYLYVLVPTLAVSPEG